MVKAGDTIAKVVEVLPKKLQSHNILDVLIISLD